MFEGQIGTIRDWRDGSGAKRTFSVTMKIRVGLQNLYKKPGISANTCNLGPESRVVKVTKHKPLVQREAFSKRKRQRMIEEDKPWPFFDHCTHTQAHIHLYTRGHAHTWAHTQITKHNTINQ